MTPEEMIKKSEECMDSSRFMGHELALQDKLNAIYWVLRAIKEDQVKGG